MSDQAVHALASVIVNGGILVGFWFWRPFPTPAMIVVSVLFFWIAGIHERVIAIDKRLKGGGSK